MTTSNLFCIVKFVEEGDCVGVIPRVWLTESDTKCYWPKKAYKKLSRSCQAPDPRTWKLCKVAVLHEYGSYDDAKANLELATTTSDLEIPISSQNDNNKVPALPKPPAASLSLNVPFEPFPHQPNQDVGQAQLLLVNSETRATPGILPNSETTAVPQITSESVVRDGLQTLLPDANPEVHPFLDISRKLDEIKAKQEEHSEVLNLIANYLATMTTSKAEEAPASLPALVKEFSFPMKSTDELIKLDDYLALDDGRTEFKRFLLGTGGSDLENAVDRSMKKVLSDELGAQYSRLGKRGKLNFSLFSNVLNSFKLSVRAYPSLRMIVEKGGAEDRSFETAFEAYFKKVADRVGQRRRVEVWKGMAAAAALV